MAGNYNMFAIAFNTLKIYAYFYALPVS